MRYAKARYKENSERKAYRIYITDALQCIAENTANYAGGSILTTRYVDMFKPVDIRAGEEIAADIIARAGLTLGD